jgi:RES domain-containing protein
MIVYRCVRRKFATNPLSGEGAKELGGRFNSVGVPVVYACEHRAMAILELAIRQPISQIAEDFVIIPIEIPESNVSPTLIVGWEKNQLSTKEEGDKLLKAGNLVIKVPSSLLNNCYNYLINPKSDKITEAKALAPEPILLDERIKQLFK